MSQTIKHSSRSESTPLITVILPIWNGEAFATEAIKSILNQTIEDFELIIIDDGSTDNTHRVIDNLASNDTRILTIFQEHAGLTVALNRGLRLARGRYVARQDADDTSLPTRFEKQLPWLEYGKYDVCCCRSISIRKRRPIPRRLWLTLPRKFLLGYMNPHIHGSFMIRRSILQSIGGYDESFDYAQDYKLLFDLYSRDIAIKYIMEPLYCTGHFETSIKMSHRQQQNEAARRVKQLFRNFN